MQHRLLLSVAGGLLGALSLTTPAIAQDQPDIVWTNAAGPASALAFAPDGSLLAVENAGVDLRRIADGSLVRTISGAFGGIGSLSLSPDSLLLAAGDGDGAVRVWRVWDGNLAWSQRASGDVTSVLFAPDATLASWSSDRNTIDLWRVADGAFERSLPDIQWSHHNVAFSPDGTLVASGGDMDPAVRLLSFADGTVVRTLTGHTARVRTVAFSTDGALVVSSGDDTTIRVWRVADGAPLYTLTNHTASVWKLATAVNGTLASAGTDGTLRLWRLADGALLRTYAIPTGASPVVEFSPDGSLFAFVAKGGVTLARNPFPAVTRQPSSRTKFAGQRVELRAAASGLEPLRFEWQLDGHAIPGATNTVLSRSTLTTNDAGRYTVLVSNPLGSIASAPATLTVLARPTGPGSLDLTFDPTDGGESVGLAGTTPAVSALAVQPDGRVLIGGRFVGVGGVPRNHLARLMADGTVDPNFNPGFGPNGEVNVMALQSDGRVLIAGLFGTADARPHSYLARVNPDGTLDETFHADVQGSDWTTPVPTSIAVQHTGQIWIAGWFVGVNGQSRSNLARLNPDGTLDTAFRLETAVPGTNQWVDRVLVQADDKVLLAGAWTGPAQSLVRLLPDGTLDDSFTGPAFSASGWPSHIEALGIHSDGRVAIIGDFSDVNGVPRWRVAWLNPDGSLDDQFNAGAGPQDSLPRALAIEPDGKLVIGGWFSQVSGAERIGFARFNVDGTLDTSFDPGNAVGHPGRPNINALVRLSDGRLLAGADAWWLDPTNCVLRLTPTGERQANLNVELQAVPGGIRAAALQPDGKVLVAGDFASVNGTARPGLARLLANGLLDAAFNPVLSTNAQIWALATQPDGKVLAGGMGDVLPSGGGGDGTNLALVRLNADGTPDPRFIKPGFQGYWPPVETLALQPDGRILAGGMMFKVNGVNSAGVARLEPNGTLDAGFQPPPLSLMDDPGFGVEFLHPLPDGKLIIAGGFTWQAGAAGGVARLQPDGTADPTFLGQLPEPRGILDAAVHPDGRIVVSGPFLLGDTYGGLVRLTAEGASDPTFVPAVSGEIRSVAAQADGAVLAVTYSLFSGRLVRLRSDGALDPVWQTAFGPDISYPPVKSVLLQPDGRVIVAGGFRNIDGLAWPAIVRVNNDAIAARLTAVGFTPQNTFELSLEGYAGVPYVLEVSADLRHWEPLLSLIHPGGELAVFDPDAGKSGQRFYRARIER